MDLAAAKIILDTALAHAVEQKYLPVAIAVIDERGAPKAFLAQDGASLKRGELAFGKANGAVAMGVGSRALMKRGETQPYFIAAAVATVGGSLIPVPGGVLVKDQAGNILGAVGISGDTSDNDEAAAILGIKAAGFLADPG